MSNIIQKPEKIASALYLITGFFADQEPLKWKLRSLSSDLVSVGISLMSQMFKERESARLEIRSIVWEMNGLIAVARNAGLVSEPNYTLLHEEFIKYLDNLGFPMGLEDENGLAVLSRNYFGNEEKQLQAPDKEGQADVLDKTTSERMSYLPEGAPHEEGVREERDNRPAPTSSKEKPLKEFGAVSVKKNSRQSVIIALLKRKKEIMIKDVSPLISGCSEKTIQRELSAMVQAGILKKMGEKRWSRYSLARP